LNDIQFNLSNFICILLQKKTICYSKFNLLFIRPMTEIDIEKENKAIARQYKELLKVSYQSLTNEDKKLIRKAFDVAVDAIKDQRKNSGKAYFFHPIAVARIVVSEIGLDAPVLLLLYCMM